MIALHNSVQRYNRAPGKHHAHNPCARTQKLKYDVAWYLKQGIWEDYVVDELNGIFSQQRARNVQKTVLARLY